MVFSNYDDSGFGEMGGDRFRVAVYEPDFRSVVSNLCGPQALARLEYRTLCDKAVTYQEFIDMVSNKRRHSFKVAVHNQDQEVMSLSEDYSALERQKLPSRKSKLIYRLSEKFSPGDDYEYRKYYSLQYRCWPPPFVIPVIIAIQITFFVYYILSSNSVPGANGPVPIDSILIYRSDKRVEVWRFVFYALLHAGWWHLIFNTMVQFTIGLPLEMVHGSFRIFLIYLAGVVAASLDVGFAIWDRYAITSYQDHPVSYVAHLAGALAGLTLGLLILKNFDQKLYQQKKTYIWWLALTTFAACLISAVVWNVYFM